MLASGVSLRPWSVLLSRSLVRLSLMPILELVSRVLENWEEGRGYFVG